MSMMTEIFHRTPVQCDSKCDSMSDHDHRLFCLQLPSSFQVVPRKVTHNMPISTTINMPDATVTLYPHFYSSDEATSIYTQLLNETQWLQQEIFLFGKRILIPRETAWYGAKGACYIYSGISLEPKPWTLTLMRIKERIESDVQSTFNSVLLNHYRNEKDSVGWHSDDEPELGNNPTIASLSLGAARKFQFQHKVDKRRVNIHLTHGSLLLMGGATQQFWKHCLPKSASATGSRINLTFRWIIHNNRIARE